MKNSKGKIVVALLVLTMTIVSAVSFAACGDETVDYASMNYGDYYSMYANEPAPDGTEGYWDYWDTKPVKYQFVNGDGSNNHGFAPYFPTLLNLFEDGTLKAWQRCTLIGSMFDPLTGETEAETEFYSENKILELFYGFWTEDSGTVTINVQNSFDYSIEGDSIQYKSYTFSTTPTDGKISFYFDATEKGQLIATNMICDTTYSGTIQYENFADFVAGNKVSLES